VILIHQRYRRTDGQTDRRHAISIPRYALVHRAVKSLVLWGTGCYCPLLSHCTVQRIERQAATSVITCAPSSSFKAASELRHPSSSVLALIPGESCVTCEILHVHTDPVLVVINCYIGCFE